MCKERDRIVAILFGFLGLLIINSLFVNLENKEVEGSVLSANYISELTLITDSKISKIDTDEKTYITIWYEDGTEISWNNNITSIKGKEVKEKIKEYTKVCFANMPEQKQEKLTEEVLNTTYITAHKHIRYTAYFENETLFFKITKI